MLQMNKNRILGVFLFGLAGVTVWCSFILIMDGFSFSLNQEMVVGLLAAFSSAAIVAYWLSPKIYVSSNYTKPLSTACGFGVLITLVSYLLGSALFSVLFIFDSSSPLDEFLFVVFVGFVFCFLYMSPGFILGGLTGMLLYYLTKPRPTTVLLQERPDAHSHEL